MLLLSTVFNRHTTLGGKIAAATYREGTGGVVRTPQGGIGAIPMTVAMYAWVRQCRVH